MRLFSRSMWATPLLVLGLAGCVGAGGKGAEDSGPTDPADSLQPLEDVNTAPTPSEDSEELEWVIGKDDDEGHHFGHGRGNVHGDISEVWAAFQIGSILADGTAVKECEWETIEPPAFDLEFVLHNVANDFGVEFDLTYQHELLDGTMEEPLEAIIVWDMTDISWDPAIALHMGSILLTAVSEDLTSVEYIEHLQSASLDTPGDLETYLTDLHDKVVDYVATGALPEELTCTDV